MKTYALGDLHGAYKALIQVLKKSNFDYEKDKLICLGDVADGWGQTPECFEELLKIKNLIYIMGNHDYWLLDYFKYNKMPHIWLSQGGKSTLKSYEDLKNMMDFEQIERHTKLLEKAKYYHIENNKLFTHGGFDWKVPIEEQDNYNLIWDRHLFQTALTWEMNDRKNDKKSKFSTYDEIYIGHTTTEAASYFNKKYTNDTKPLLLSNVIALDTGAGMTGVLTLMNIDTKDYFQSDLSSELYPDEKGRKG